MRALRDAVLGQAGSTATALRQAIFARAASFAGRAPTASPVTGALATYVDTVAQHAYRVTPEQLAALQAAGHSEDALVEVTLSAAMGAGLARLERGLAALKGAKP